jgi:hypothetical protein
MSAGRWTEMKGIPDYVERRVVVEFGLQYVYLYMTDGAGKLSDEESFKQPYRLERKEVAAEARDVYDLLYDSLNETINFPTAGSSGGDGKPEE